MYKYNGTRKMSLIFMQGSSMNVSLEGKRQNPTQQKEGEEW